MNLKEISTRELLSKFAEAGLSINKEMAEEIIRRNDAVKHIFEFLEDERYWNEIGDGWFPIHAIFLLALIRTKEAFEVFKWVLKNKAEELEDWLTEDVPSLLFYFGKEFFDEIKEIALDKSFDIFVRNAAIKAICALAVVNEEAKEKAVEVCKLFLQDENHELVGLSLPEIAEIKDEELFALVREKFESIPFAKKVTDLQDLIELHEGKSKSPEYVHCLNNPWDHFSEENLRRLRKYNYEETL